MPRLFSILSKLERPRLLVRAARFGLNDYRRERDLSRILRFQAPASVETAMDRLISIEAEIEEIRKTGDATYSPNRHIEVLIALMAEARLLPAQDNVCP